MTDNELIEGLLTHTDKDKLNKFLKEYAKKDSAFKQALIDTFLPKEKSSVARQKQHRDYAESIRKVFKQHSIKEYNRYRDEHDEYGFQAAEVCAKLEPMLEKAHFFAKQQNLDEAVQIAQSLIETIPEEWDENFDYEGDVQDI